MSTLWTVLGSIAMLGLVAPMAFMLVVFSGGALANGRVLSAVQEHVLDVSLWLLPMLCVLSAGIVIYLHRHGGSALAYAWYALPFAGVAAYLVWANALTGSR